MIGDKRDESFTSGYQAGFAQAIVAAAIRAGLADSPQAAAVAIRELSDPENRDGLAAHDQKSREDNAFTAGYDEGRRALRELVVKWRKKTAEFSIWDDAADELEAAEAGEPQCIGPFGDAFDCPVHDPRKIGASRLPAPTEKERALHEAVEGVAKLCERAHPFDPDLARAIRALTTPERGK